MEFSENRHHLAELVFHGATELDPEKIFPKDVIQTLATWNDRPNRELSGADLLQLDGCALFSINYEGDARNYWPNESENEFTEILVREFMYRNGIRALADNRAQLFRARYSLIALSGDEYLLVCPYLTAAGDIAGLVVVTVTKLFGKIRYRQ